MIVKLRPSHSIHIFFLKFLQLIGQGALFIFIPYTCCQSVVDVDTYHYFYDSFTSRTFRKLVKICWAKIRKTTFLIFPRWPSTATFGRFDFGKRNVLGLILTCNSVFSNRIRRQQWSDSFDSYYDDYSDFLGENSPVGQTCKRK